MIISGFLTYGFKHFTAASLLGVRVDGTVHLSKNGKMEIALVGVTITAERGGSFELGCY